MKNNQTMHIETPENRKVLYYLKSQNLNNIAKIISIDEVEDRDYEVLFENDGILLNEIFDKDNKLSLKVSLNYLGQMADALRALHDADEPVAVKDLELSDFVLDNEEIKFVSLNKLIWAEPEYVALNIQSYLNIVRSLLNYINFDGERNIEHLKGLPDLRFRTMDLVKLELQRIHQSCFKPYNPNMPIGFRSGVVKNNVIALLVYFALLNIAFRFDFSEYTSVSETLCRIIFFLIMIVVIFFVGDYKNVQSFLGLSKIKNKKLRFLIVSILSVLLFVILMFVFFSAIRLVG